MYIEFYVKPHTEPLYIELCIEFCVELYVKLYIELYVKLYVKLYAFILLSLLRGEGALKSLPKLLTVKPGSKLFQTELTCDFATCCQVLLRVLVYHMIIYMYLLSHHLILRNFTCFINVL